VRLFDTIVGQRVHWQPRFGSGAAFLIGSDVPTPTGEALAEAQWGPSGDLSIRPIEPSASAGQLGLTGQWHWNNQRGVSVDVDMVPWRPGRRISSEPWGDVALLVLMLTLMVGVGQVNYLLRQIWAAMPTSETAYEPTPELIARLLKEDYDGEERGRQHRADRPEASRKAPSFYLPAGHQGDWERTGGGENVGDEVRRGADEEPALAELDPPAPPADADDAVELKAEPQIRAPEAPPEPPAPAVEVSLEQEEEDRGLAKPIERFIGWGFKDWFEVQDGREEQEERIAEILERTRVRLKIDPNDPQAIQTAAYYAYLAENHELGAALHERFISLYPDEPSGYNNLALTHKRRGDYVREEALYRRALKLDPLDHHVINNLAVNLAHQGRFDEALSLMATLEDLTPGDPYADLHRAKIYAAMGKKRKAYKLLKKALASVDDLDTLHHIEFRQDIRVDPAFDKLRGKWGFKRILRGEYGDDAEAMVGKTKRSWWQRAEVADG
jgi:tetratricopeptide (TPR) repeat protein